MRTDPETCNENGSAHDTDLGESPRRPVETMTEDELRDLAVKLVSKLGDGYDQRGYGQPWTLEDEWSAAAGDVLRDDHGIEPFDEDGDSTEEFNEMVSLVESKMRDKWLTTSVERLATFPEAMADRFDDSQIESELHEAWETRNENDDIWWGAVSRAAATVAENRKKA